MMSVVQLDPHEQIKSYFTFAWKPIRLREDKRPRDEGWPESWVSEEEMLEWYEGGGNVGIQVGKVSDWLCCVDLDSEEAMKLAPKFLPETLMAGKERETLPSHYIYRSEGADYLQITDGAEEILALKAAAEGQGHQFVVAPSAHVQKGSYKWIPSFNPAAMLDIGAEKLVVAVKKLGLACLIYRYLPTEGRHNYSLSIAGALLRRGYDPNALAEIFSIVWDAARAPRDGQKAAQKNVYDTASKLGEDEPLKADGTLEDTVQGLLKPLLKAAGLKRFSRVGSEEGSSEEEEKPDDSELAQRWLYKHSTLKHSTHGWMRYSGGAWEQVEDGLVTQSVTRFLSETPGVKVSANKVSSVHRLASEHSYIRSSVWDAKDDIVVCKNGTLDLNTFTLRDHRPEDYAMGALPFDYDPNAVPEAWNEFIGQRLGDTWPFLQEFAGYCLTTDTSHEIALWLLGEGGTGKSTFVEGVTQICGSRAGRLGLADIERSSFALENIVGKTLLTATEQPSMFIKQVDVINTLVSGEVLSVNRKNKPIIDVRGSAKLMWAMNESPKLREGASGVFRRIKIVNFPKLDAPTNPAIKERIMTLEGPGILNWAIEGLKRLRERGEFVIPDSVRDAVDEFQYQNDPPRQFIDSMCVLDSKAKIPRSELYETYSKWAKKMGFHAKSVAQVKEDFVRLGLSSKKLNGKHYFAGIRLSNDPEVNVDDL